MKSSRVRWRTDHHSHSSSLGNKYKALTVANTYQGMSVDIGTRKSRLGRVTGGVSGPAIKPLTLRLAYEASRAVKIPIIGLGGIEKAEDVMEYLIVGASAVQVGTANFSNPKACEDLVDALEKECIKFKALRINSLIATLDTNSA